jgi:O-methyltransferase involved in polyketide biosynthesis
MYACRGRSDRYTAGVRDFSTISPSARWLLLAKAHSGLPFARQAAELMFGADKVAEAAQPASPADAVRRRHFELRARSIDQALDLVGATRVLELAAGYSLRGLARAGNGADYLDTDLPDVVELKAALVEQLAGAEPATPAGRYRLEALDILDEAAFGRAVASLREGPIAIVHEGLLMYLDAAEKAHLAAHIHAALRARGGHWVTADIYLRRESTVPREEKVEKFLAEHRVEDNKFASWDEAEAFVRGAGFAIEHRLAPTADPALVRETWILTARQ